MHLGKEGYMGFEPKGGVVVIYDFSTLKEKARKTFDFPIARIGYSKSGNMLGIVIKQFEGEAKKPKTSFLQYVRRDDPAVREP